MSKPISGRNNGYYGPTYPQTNTPLVASPLPYDPIAEEAFESLKIAYGILLNRNVSPSGRAWEQYRAYSIQTKRCKYFY